VLGDGQAKRESSPCPAGLGPCREGWITTQQETGEPGEERLCPFWVDIQPDPEHPRCYLPPYCKLEQQ